MSLGHEQSIYRGGFKNATCSIFLAERSPPRQMKQTQTSAHERQNNRSGVFSILHSTSTIGSSLSAFSSSHGAESIEKGYFDTEILIIEVDFF